MPYDVPSQINFNFDTPTLVRTATSMLIADVRCLEAPKAGVFSAGTYEKCRYAAIVLPSEFGQATINQLDEVLEPKISKLTPDISHENKHYFVDEKFDPENDFYIYTIVIPQKNMQGDFTGKYIQAYLKINIESLTISNDIKPEEQSLEMHSILLRLLQHAGFTGQMDDTKDIYVEGGQIGGFIYILTYENGKPVADFQKITP